MRLNLQSGRIDCARWRESPNQDDRDPDSEPECIILHCISLPPGEYSNGAVERFFMNELRADEHPYYRKIAHLAVSAHFMIARNGALIQFVATHKRAWHAGESVCLGRPKVNNFSIGIELEGLDTDEKGFSQTQYATLNSLIVALTAAYPKISATNVFAHSDIAPGRKPDPGPYFDWNKVF